MPDPATKYPIQARWFANGQEYTATVLNPGDWKGQAWLVHQDEQGAAYYIAEGGDLGYAEDVFVDSNVEPSVRIDPGAPEIDDYGYSSTFTVRLFDQDVTLTAWQTLSGKIITDPAVGRFLSEPDVTGTGIHYDASGIAVQGDDGVSLPWPCRYYGPGLPAHGVDPRSYAAPCVCAFCNKEFYIEHGAKVPDFCSPACALRTPLTENDEEDDDDGENGG